MKTSLRYLCPPPRRVRPAGEILSATFVAPPPFVVPHRTKNKARANGIRYEKKAHAYLEEAFPDSIVLGPWIKFRAKGQAKAIYCQPDALILDIRLGTITVIEIKLKHTSDAWWQVRRLYLPLVQSIFGEEWDYIAVEVAKWFDPHTKFPEWFEFADSIEKFSTLSPKTFHLHLWNGSGSA